MNTIDKNVQVLSDLQIDVRFQDLKKQIKTSKNSTGIFETAQKTLENVQGKWNPGILFQWFDFEIDPKTRVGRILQKSGQAVHLDLGFNSRDTGRQCADDVVVLACPDRCGVGAHG